MAYTQAEVAVGTTATLLFTGATAKDLWVRASREGPVLYVGPAGVTPANGFPVRGEFHVLSTVAGDDLYGVTDAPGGTVKVRTLVRT